MFKQFWSIIVAYEQIGTNLINLIEAIYYKHLFYLKSFDKMKSKYTLNIFVKPEKLPYKKLVNRCIIKSLVISWFMN